MIQLFIRMRWCHPPEKVLILGRQKLILIPSQVDVERKVGLITYILAVTCKSSMPNVHSSFSKLLASYYWSSSAYKNGLISFSVHTQGDYIYSQKHNLTLCMILHTIFSWLETSYCFKQQYFILLCEKICRGSLYRNSSTVCML